LALSIALMASAGALAYVLEHDAVGEARLASAAPGDEVTAKGILKAFAPRPTTAREAAQWADIARSLDNATYLLETEGEEVVLVTTSRPTTAVGHTVVVNGPVLLRAPHPDGSGRPLLVIAQPAIQQPILFR
jgi:hypothetical protein